MEQYEQKIPDLLELSINDFFALKNMIKKLRTPTLKMKTGGKKKNK